MRKKSPLAERVIPRIQARLQSDPKKALDYAVTIAMQFPKNLHIREAIRQTLGATLAPHADSAIAQRQSEKLARDKKQQDELNALVYAEKERQGQHVQVLRESLEKARRINQVEVFLAALPTDDRADSGATRKEIAAAVALRQAALRSTVVKERLRCTDAELRRWSEDGRLPILFRRRMPSNVGVILDVRHWDADLVEQAIQMVNEWREQDLEKRKRTHSR